MLEGLEVLGSLLAGAPDVVLGGTELHGLLALGLGAGQNNNVVAHRGGELDGDVAETTNAHDTNTFRRAHAVFGEDSPDGGTGAHEGSGVDGAQGFGDGVNAVGVPDGAVAEGAVVEVVEAILLDVTAVLVPA